MGGGGSLRRVAALTAVAAALVWPGAALGAGIETVFWEDFNGYTYFPHGGGDPANNGIPEISEGADEFWYGARFEYFDGGTINQDLAVQKVPGGGRPSPDPVGRFEDEAGLVLRLPVGLDDITLSFDWRLFSAGSGDQIRVGYFVGDLGFDTGANRFRDFFTDDFGGNQAAAVNWWNTQWTQLLVGSGSAWQVESFNLVDDTLGGEEMWIAFWLDNGEGDYAKLDNIHVEAEIAPELPAGSMLLLGLAVLARRKLRAG